jgi:hypothetical protein
MRKTITLKLTPDLINQITAHSKRHERSISWIVKNLVNSRFLQIDKLNRTYNHFDFSPVPEKLTISIPMDSFKKLQRLLKFYRVKSQDFLRTEIHLLTRGGQ